MNPAFASGRFLRLVLFLVALPSVSLPAAESDGRWWPLQTLPKTIARTSNQHDFPEPRLAHQMMVQSAAGLAAKAVNEGRSSELVWVYNGEGDLEKWHTRLLMQHPGITTPGTFAPWPLVDRYAKQGLIKGYILYRGGKADRSVNVATSLAGILDGVIVSEELEKTAQGHGLKLLLDVRDKTQSWCFQTYKDHFNRRLLCTQDPRRPHARDLAIAQKAFTLYGLEEPLPAAMKWLEPLSPILGWNTGDEFHVTDLSSSHGHIQTATDWCLNLPVLMAGTENISFPKKSGFDPRTIDWKDSRSGICFIDTDGDNVQWLQGNFFSNPGYWGNPARAKIPFGWSTCFAHLAQLCPQAVEFAWDSRRTNDSFIEWGGGYFYPDHFARQLPNRWELLAQHTRRTWTLMQQTGTRILGYNFAQCNSPDAHKACEVIASQTDGLLAILVFQYAPYEAGAGKTWWVKDRRGIEVPVITARYSIWEHANGRPRAGTPAKVAREIRQTVEKTPPSELPRYDWAIAHAWSYFKSAPGTDENAENMPQENASEKGGLRGYTPVTWCAERLPNSIRIITPDELAWRLRMRHNPSGTRAMIDAQSP